MKKSVRPTQSTRPTQAAPESERISGSLQYDGATWKTGVTTKYPINYMETVQLVLKGSLGYGVIATPYAFRKVGSAFGGTLLTLFLGIIFIYCTHQFVRNAHIIGERQEMTKLSYPRVVRLAFLSGPPNYRHLSGAARITTLVLLIFVLLVCCSLYLMYIAVNMAHLFEFFNLVVIDNDGVNIAVFLVALIFPLVILTLLLRNLKFVTQLALYGNIFILIGMVFTHIYAKVELDYVKNMSTRMAGVKEMISPTVAFGVIVFALQNIAIIMPLENEIKPAEYFMGFPFALHFPLTISVILHIIFGYDCYMHFGINTKDSITDTLFLGNKSSCITIFNFSLGLLFSFSLPFHALFNLIWSLFKNRIEKSPVKRLIMQLLTRFLLLLLCLIFAVPLYFTNILAIIGLIGSTCLVLLGIIIPMLVDIFVCYEIPGYNNCKSRLVVNYIIIALGIIIFLGGTIGAILEFF